MKNIPGCLCEENSKVHRIIRVAEQLEFAKSRNQGNLEDHFPRSLWKCHADNPAAAMSLSCNSSCRFQVPRRENLTVLSRVRTRGSFRLRDKSAGTIEASTVIEAGVPVHVSCSQPSEESHPPLTVHSISPSEFDAIVFTSFIHQIMKFGGHIVLKRNTISSFHHWASHLAWTSLSAFWIIPAINKQLLGGMWCAVLPALSQSSLALYFFFLNVGSWFHWVKYQSVYITP